MKPFSGSGGAGAASSKPDSYFSDDVIEAVLGISEGPIKGLKGGTAKNFYVGETPLLNINGESNFSDFELNVNIGSELGELIIPTLGGQSSSTTVGTQLSYNVPVVRQASHGDIDWIDLRFVVNQLLAETDDGARARELKLQIEIKPSSATDWTKPIIYAEVGTTTTENENNLKIVHRSVPGSVMSAARTQAFYYQSTTPSPTEDERSLGAAYGHRVLWVDTSIDAFHPKFYSAGEFFAPDNLTVDTTAGKEVAEFDDTNYIALIDPERGNVKRRIYYWASGTPTGPSVGDLWFQPATSTVLWFNGASWVSTLGATGYWSVTTGNKVIDTDGVLVINEKISSSAVREVKLKVDRTGDTFDLRVTKLTEDSENLDGDRTDVTWESFQEVVSEPMRFPGLATVQLRGRASNQFSSLPDMSGVYEGRIVKVPSNYDPVARTYAGVWDGTWKQDYSNNPAFVGYDLVDNDRYGMSATYPITLDPMDVYEAGVWCDTLLPSGKPQFTFNMLVKDPQSPRELATYIFGIFGGRFFDDGNGYARLRLDNQTTAVHLFAKENVKNGVFRYSYTEIESRINDYTVSFKNPDLFYATDRRRVPDQPSIDAYGRAPDDFVAVGCNNADEAIYRASIKLITGLTEVETVTFETAREGLYLEPYDVILVADDTMDEVITGRITGTTDTRTFTLRDNVYLEDGFEYEIVVNLNNFEIVTLPIAISSVGSVTKVLTVTEDIPANLPTQAVFSIGTAAKAYRVMTIGENEEEDESVTITAIEVNRTKYADAAERPGLPVVPVPEFPTDLASVTNLRITPWQEVRNGRPVQNLRVEWDAHPNKFVRSYSINSRRNDDQWQFQGEVKTPRFELFDVSQGRYTFSVQALAMTGQKSVVGFVDIDLTGTVREVAAVKNLTLVNQSGTSGSLHLFEDVLAQFKWEPGDENPALSVYQVRIYDSSETLLRTLTVGEPNFTYTQQMMRVDSATRQFKVQVIAQDLHGNTSDPTTILVKNPAPAAPALAVNPGFGMVEAVWATDVVDYVGTLVWVANAPGIDPSSRPADYDLKDGHITIPTDPDEACYVRVALYDTLGKTELNYSAEIFAQAFSEVDTDAPATPTGLTVNSIVEQLTNGQQQIKLTATCTANTEDDLAGYLFEIKEGTGNYVGFSTNTPVFSWFVKPGVSYTVRVTAFDKAGNKSAPSAGVLHTASKDTTPPAPPTAVTAVGGIDGIFLGWTPPADADLAYIEIYENTTNNSGTATLIQKAPGRAFVRSSIGQNVTRYYWLKAVDTSGNKSAFTAVVSATTSEVAEDDQFTFDGVIFKPNDGATNKLTWTGGSISYGPGGVAPTTKTISAGFVTWASGTVYVYYVKGNTALSNTTNLATVYGSGGTIMGVYKGGTSFQLVEGDAWLDGAKLLAQTVGANQLVTGSAVITGSAQIGTGIINDAHIQNLSAAKIIGGSALLGTITVNGRTIASATNDSVLDDMSSKNWTFTGTGTADWPSGAYPTGSNALRMNGQVGALSPDLYPYDPNKLYKITANVFVFTGATGGLYIGLRQWDGTKTFLADNNQVCANLDETTLAGTGWQKIVGYVRGVSGGTNGNNTTVAAPGSCAANTAYISPRVFPGFPSGTGLVSLDSIRIDVVDEDAAAVVNAGTTKIDGGMVVVSGGTTINDWRYGGDNTKINGGVIAANTLLANTGVFGLRGIAPDGITFEHNSPSANGVSWTAGNITYTDDTGATVTKAIAAGSATWTTGTVYIYYTQGSTTLTASVNPTFANGPNNVILATYKGGTNLVSNYGRTIIDGSGIKAVMAAFDTAAINTMRSNVLIAGSIKSDMVDTNTIYGRHIALTDPGNLIPDNQMMDIKSWIQTFGIASTWSVTAISGAWKSQGQFRFDPATKQATGFSGFVSQNFPVDPSQKYRMSGQIYRQTGTVAQVWLRVQWFTATGTSLGFTHIVNNTTVWSLNNELTEVAPPATTSYGRYEFFVNQANIDGITYFGGLQVQTMNGASLTVAGSIKGTHLEGDTLFALKGTLGTVDISEAVLGTLQVGEANIGDLAVTSHKVCALEVTP